MHPNDPAVKAILNSFEKNPFLIRATLYDYIEVYTRLTPVSRLIHDGRRQEARALIDSPEFGGFILDHEATFEALLQCSPIMPRAIDPHDSSVKSYLDFFIQHPRYFQTTLNTYMSWPNRLNPLARLIHESKLNEARALMDSPDFTGFWFAGEPSIFEALLQYKRATPALLLA